MRLALPLFGGLLAILVAGCASSDGVRQLSEQELAAFDTLAARLDENGRFFRDATETLADLNAHYARMAFGLELGLAKAKLLESMQAPWAPVRDSLQATQRAVILYHLYEIEAAEQKVLDARIRERRAATEEVWAAYLRLGQLVEDASRNLKVVLAHFNQPRDARIRAFTSTFLSEVTAFRAQLQASENPRLQQLAADVARYEAQAHATKAQAERTLDALLEMGGQ